MTKDAACGDTKGCFSDCDGGSCQFVVSWTSAGDKGQYTLQAPVSGPSTHIAVGFSSDAQMVMFVSINDGPFFVFIYLLNNVCFTDNVTRQALVDFILLITDIQGVCLLWIYTAQNRYVCMSLFAFFDVLN